MLSIAPKLGDCLSNKDVEPVKAFWLVAVDIVIRFAQYGSGC